ncbi:histidine kinase dimerization/phospho-acceptor domain-containing protein [Nocardioides sp.]|uniref:histidine kinase dimerization/phospho-acceptor domain-containing protein n=1 Tax=Nocardioides sp. TaxID=35761 RepID=UPI003783CC94
MRERLTIAFVLLTVVLLLGAGVVRSFVLRDLIREQESAHLHQEVELVAAIAEDRLAAGGAVDEAFLRSVVGDDARIEYASTDGATVVTHGTDYDGTDDPAQDMSASATIDAGTITMSQSDQVIKDIIGRDLGALAALFVLIAVVAGLVGFIIASLLSAPFQRLAVAAGNLGRGRFDLELPNTRIPEARAISNALRTSATQLEDRVHRERQFAEHASHVLKTPLTGLRLELEDLTLRDDVPTDVKQAAARSLDAVDSVSTVAGELVEMSRRGSLVAGAELPLVDLATQLAQRWADRLSARSRTLSAAAEGNLALTYTPGPVEHVTDLLLADVVRRGSGPVRLVFNGEEGGQLRVHVQSESRLEEHGNEHHDDVPDRIAQARTVVEALGGRVLGDDPAAGIDVLLPRR